MNKKPAKKLFAALIFMLFAGVFAHTVNHVEAKADSLNVSRDCFEITGLGSSYVKISFKMPSTEYCCDIALYDVHKNMLSQVHSDYTQGTESLSAAIKNNKVYYFRVKPVKRVKLSNGTIIREDAGAWSPYKAVCTVKLKTKVLQRKTLSEKVVVPKVVGVKNVKVMISKNKKGQKGDKKVKTLKPGKSYVITKCGSNKLKRGVDYYLKPRITLTDGTPCAYAYIAYFRIL